MILKKCFTLVLSLSFVNQSVFAETWVAFPNQNLNDRQSNEKIGEFKKIYPNKIVIPIFDGMQHEGIGNKKIGQLKELFERAESAFFANDFAQARALHRQFSQSLLESPFRGAIKTYLTRSLLRQSQVPSEHENTREILARAVSLDPLFSPINYGFSPTQIERWNQALNARSKKAFPVKIQLPARGVVFLDGQKLNLADGEHSFLVPEGFHHLSALIPNHQWSVQTFELTGSSVQKIEFTPLVSGTCEHPLYLGDDLPRGIEAAALFESNCAVVFKDDNKASLLVKNGGPVELPPQLEPGIKSDLAREFDREPSGFEKTIKSPWLWVALGAVVAGVLINNSQNESGRVVPVHTFH